jgi:hypothetical protein
MTRRYKSKWAIYLTGIRRSTHIDGLQERHGYAVGNIWKQLDSNPSNPSKHLLLHPLAQNMPDQDVRFLNPGGVRGGNVEQDVA